MLRAIAFLVLFPRFAPAVLAECPDGFLCCIGGVNTYVNTPDPVRALDCSRFHVDSHSSFDHVPGLASAQSLSVPGTETTTQQLRLDMNVKAGQEDEISLIASAFSSGNAGGYAPARRSFDGLPPGSTYR